MVRVFATMRRPRVQFTVRQLMIGVATVALITAGTERALRPSNVCLGLTRPPQSSSTDHEIYNTVLPNLIGYKQLNPWAGRLDVKKPQVVLCDRTRGEVACSGLDYDSSAFGIAIPSDIRADVMRRNPRGNRVSLAGYHPPNPNILVRDPSGIDQGFGFFDQYPGASRYVVPSLPGYSEDGSMALFRFSIGPEGYHPSWGSYLLKQGSRRWKVIGRQIYELH
jgi:hypothetical protein